MDKQTLSNYGWIVICILVLSVMIAFATPFGIFIADAVKSTSNGLFDVNQAALGAAGIIIVDNELTKYSIINNPTAEVTQGDVLVLQSNADYGKFVKVTANGEDVPEKYYTVSEGSTIVTFTVEFSKDYTGTYEFVIVSNDGTAKITITIENHESDNEEMVMLGDLNRDNSVGFADYLHYQLMLSGLKQPEPTAADINQDGVFNVIDEEIMRLINAGDEDTIVTYPNIGTYVPVNDESIVIEYYPNLVGDVNGDGRINGQDAFQVQRLLAGSRPVDETNLVACDANGDKIISTTDAEMIQNYGVGISVDGSIVGQYRQDVDNSEYTIEYATTE